ncbi:MAG: CBS domain-containing protein [Deltaproteobacteria bacterium]|nr:CBS domain-containing protein [Deltaproteobacteria bacterium]
MTAPALCCRVDDMVDRPARAMADNDYGCAVVVDGDGRLLGILTMRDVVRAAVATGKRLDKIRVGEAMTAATHGCTTESGLAQAESIMQRWHVRRLPVTGPDGRVVGVLSLDDLARTAARAKVSRAKIDVSLAGVGATLATICEPLLREDGPKATSRRAR